MTSIKEKIKTKKHEYWVKCILGLNKTSRALYKYVVDKLRKYIKGQCILYKSSQKYFTKDELSHISTGAGCIRTKIHTKIKYKRNKQTNKSKWEWTNQCPDCKEVFEKILALHTEVIKDESFKDIHWINCSDTSNITLEWAIAKIFMPEGNEKNNGPEDTDPAALLTLMLNCDLFENATRHNPKFYLKKARNSLCHSPDNHVKENDKNSYFELMTALLTDASNDKEVDQEIRDTIVKDKDEIEKLKESEITLTLFDDALKEKRKAIYNDFEKCISENDVEQLRGLLKLAEKVAADLQFINDNFDEMKKIEIYKNEIQQLKTKLKSLHEQTKTLKESQENIKQEVRSELEGFRNFQTELQSKSKEHLLGMKSHLSSIFNSIVKKTKSIKDSHENIKHEVRRELEGFKKFQTEIQLKSKERVHEMEIQLFSELDLIKEKTRRMKESQENIKQEVRSEFESFKIFQTELQLKSKQHISEMEEQQSSNLTSASRQIFTLVKDIEEKTDSKLSLLSEHVAEHLHKISRIDSDVSNLREFFVNEKEKRKAQREIISSMRESLGHMSHDLDRLQQARNETSLLLQGCKRLELGVSSFCRDIINGVSRLNTDGFVVIVVVTIFLALMFRLWVLQYYEET